MATEHNQPGRVSSNDIDKVLAALRNTIPPAGMEDRIAHRLQSEAAASTRTPSRLQSLVAGIIPTAAWWRGALTGAACALAAVLVVTHTRATPSPQNSANPSPAKEPISLSTGEGITCQGLDRVLLPHHDSKLIAGQFKPHLEYHSATPSRLAPTFPLTAQERALLQLARMPNAAALALPTPEEQAKQQAEEQARFEKFFAPPPLPPAEQAQAIPEPAAVTE